MSTYYYGNIYKRNKETKDYELLNKEPIDMWFYKSNLLSGWDTEGVSVYSDSVQLDQLCKNTTSFQYVKYLGRIKVDDLKKEIPDYDIGFGKAKWDLYFKYNKLTKAEEDSDDILLDSIDTFDYRCNHVHDYDVSLLKNLYDKNLFVEMSNEEMTEYMKMSKDEKKEYNKKFYNVHYRYNIYHTGEFFNVTSFLDVEKDCEEKLKNIIIKNVEWENLKKSIDYLKLPSEEKERIWESYQYEITDEDNYYKNKLKACLKMRQTLEIFDDSFESNKDSVIWFVWADTAEKTDEPDWVFGKDKLLGRYL